MAILAPPTHFFVGASIHLASFNRPILFIMRYLLFLTPCLLLPWATINAEIASGDGYRRTAAPEQWVIDSNQRWMGKLDENLFLSELSIPGTHDSAALYGGDLVECQSWDLDEQLNAGIRYFDIRCRPTNTHAEGGVFAIHHGAVYQKINFGTVQYKFERFLRENPSEVIIMSLKDEHRPGHVSEADFSKIFNDYMATYPNLYYTADATPRLLDAKGQVVLIKRYGDSTVGGIGWGSSKLVVHDDWEVPTLFAIPDHREGIKTALEAAVNQTNRHKWHLTYTNGASSGAYPNAVAWRTNDYVLEWIEAFGQTDLGTIIMDFPSERMIDSIIRSNFQPHKLRRNQTSTASSSSTTPPPPPKYFAKIKKVFCRQSSESGWDEVFITMSDGTRFPSSGWQDINEDSGKDSTWTINKTVEITGGSLRLNLIEDDNSYDDNLGTVVITEKVGSHSKTVTGDDGEYVIYWEVSKQ